jgi:hypothetical protein
LGLILRDGPPLNTPFELAILFRREQSAIPLFLLVDTLLGFAQNSFEKQ